MASSSSFKYDLYLSYHYDSRDTVKDFNIKLKNEKFKTCWIDAEKQQQQKPETIENRICQSECFICFLSKKYLDSEQNRNELKLASKNKKRIFLIKLDNIRSLSEETHSDLITVIPFSCFNFYFEYASIRNSVHLLVKSMKDSLKSLDSISQANNCHIRIFKNGRYEGELVGVIIKFKLVKITRRTVLNG